MAKNYSVEWLSQSFHCSSTTVGLERPKDAAIGFLKPHVPCVVQPRAPTFYKEVSVEPKTRQKTPLLLQLVSIIFIGMLTVAVCIVVIVTVNVIPCRLTVNVFSDSCGYTSGSESDVGDDSEGETYAHRRMRTKFTSDQIYRLEKTFNKHKYLGATQRRKMAERLHLSETQVKTWFQNRRMKLKREVQDLRAEYFAPALLCQTAFPTAASLQHHGYGGQRVALTPAASAPYRPLIQQLPVQQMIPSPLIHPLFFPPHYYAQL
ncbi:homeobox protein vent1-like [Anguilla anguilla]|uniref:homeobox protein vent1-like n=1 Tax=Anguilla anguilla TaxID=7936 RepID=UPI0015B22992|nr:homeobox protein vent1-like [Anguilla anguilla]